MSLGRIALFRALFLGDMLCAVPTLRTLRDAYPEAEVTLIGLPWASDFARRFGGYIDGFVEFKGYPGIREVEADEGAMANFIEAQRAYGYDLALQLHGSGEVSNGFVADLTAGRSAGYALPGDDRLSFALPWREEEHEVLRWLRLVEAVTGVAGEPDLEFPVTAEEQARADELLGRYKGRGTRDEGTGRQLELSPPRTSRPLVALHAGAKAPARRWRAEWFAELGDELAARGATVLLTGSEGERDITIEVGSRMACPVLDLTGQTDLGELAGVLRRLDLLVTNDTGVSHLAAAVGTPSVVLFGPTRPSRWAPLNTSMHIALDATAITGLDGSEALQHLPVDAVLEAALTQLPSPHNQSKAGGPSAEWAGGEVVPGRYSRTLPLQAGGA